MSPFASTMPQSPEATLAAPITPGTAKKRMLIVVNPYATTVSDQLKNLVVYALQARYEVEAVDTEASEHAIEIGREARSGDYDIVVAFGGDGTVNEVANGLAGTDVPLSVLPGGSTNVAARTLGIPNDVVDATEHLIAIADNFQARRIDLGVVNGRRFVFACGIGLDATVMRRVDTHPILKARARHWYYTASAIAGFYKDYLRNPPRLEVELEGRKIEGITAVAQNAEQLTFFGRVPMRFSESARLADGTLGVAVLKRAAQRDIPTLLARSMSDRLQPQRHRQIESIDGIREATVRSISVDAEGRPRSLPVQVDGDYIGDQTEVHWSVDPGALTVVA